MAGGTTTAEDLLRDQRERYATANYTVGGRDFQSKRLDPQAQIHCIRRIAPMVKAAGPILKLLAEGKAGGAGLKAALLSGGVADDDAEAEGPGLDTMDALAALGPLADVMAAMSDADVDYVIGKCLGVTQSRNTMGSGWADVTLKDGARMFPLGMNALLRICFETLKHSLSDAFPDLVKALEDATAQMGQVAPKAA